MRPASSHFLALISWLSCFSLFLRHFSVQTSSEHRAPVMADLQRPPVPSSWQNLKGKIFPIKEKGTIMFSASVSAQELRNLDFEEDEAEDCDESSPSADIIKDCIRSTDAETTSSEASTSVSEVSANLSISSPGRRFLRLLKRRSLRRLPTMPPVSVPTLSRKFRSTKESSSSKPAVPTDPEFLCFLRPSWKSFSLTELKAATNNFSSKNIIGRGGYAEVYKGHLQDGQFVAIKRLTRGTTEEMINDFLSELGIIVHINHPNAAKLIGFGVDGGMHLVLRLSVHGSLAELLTGPKEKLNWSTRYKIALGTAEGLQYLHEGCPRRIIHRDIKSANILLTEDFEAQICDFGLAKWLPDQWTHHTVSKFEGTFGYLAPEYLLHGIVDEKTDVYAFGVVLLELITGRMAIDSSQQSLVMWAKPLLEKYEVSQLVDPSLGDAYDPEELHHVTVAASMCIQHSSLSRPRMRQVIEFLRGEEGLHSIKPREIPRLQRVYSEETLDADEYNSTRYLNDLNRFRQVALGS